MLLGVMGCGRQPGPRSSEAGSYGTWDPQTRASNDTTAARTEIPPWAWPSGANTSVAQSSLAPYSLWHTRERVVRWFAGLAEAGMGGPTFLAYSSPTGIATMPVGGSVEGGQMRENWLLVGFPGAEGWKDWDSPWAIFLQRRPGQVTLGTNGVEATFTNEAAHFALMPLYGYYKPPQKGREILKAQGLKEKELLTWEWPIVVARDPLTRLRYWAGATRWFPYDVETTLSVGAGGESLTAVQRFRALAIPDDWRTRPVKVAPVSPVLGLALKSEPAFPAEVKPRPFDFELATPQGPYFAVPEAESVTVTLPLLGLVSTAEVLTDHPPATGDAQLDSTLRQVRERVAGLMRERFGSAAMPSAGIPDDAMREGLQWYARALPWADSATRSNAATLLRRWLVERGLSEEAFRAVAGGVAWPIVEKWQRETVEGVWAYAHHSGDHELVRERWDQVMRILTSLPGETQHGGMVPAGREDRAPQFEWRLGMAVASARLAYMARDPFMWMSANRRVGEALVREHIRWAGGRWIREQQPWHSMDPLPAALRLDKPQFGGGGWVTQEVEAETELAAFLGRAVWDPEVGRYARQRLASDLGASLKRWEEGDKTATGLDFAAIRGWLTPTGMTNQWRFPGPDLGTGSDAQVLAACLGWARWAGAMPIERLIPESFSRFARPGIGFVLAPSRGLTHRLRFGVSEGTPADRRQAAARLVWPDWKGSSEGGWSFGDVTVGERGALEEPTFELLPSGGTESVEVLSWVPRASAP